MQININSVVCTKGDMNHERNLERSNTERKISGPFKYKR